jgi:hypothetical protein
MRRFRCSLSVSRSLLPAAVAIRVRRATRAHKVLPDRRVHKAFKVWREPKGQPARRGLRARRGSPAKRETKAIRAPMFAPCKPTAP